MFREIKNAFYGNEQPARSFSCLSASTNAERGYGGPTGSLENVFIFIFHIPQAVVRFYLFPGCKWMDLSFLKRAFLFQEIALRQMTMSSGKERNTDRLRAGSSARAVVKGIGDIRSGGLSLFLLCAGANRI